MTKTFRQAALAMSMGLAAFAPSAFAATAQGNFNVSVVLTPKCEIVGTIGVLSVNYESFQTAASTGNTSFSMRCTSGQGFSVALDGNGSYNDPDTSLGYTLKLSSNASAPGGSDTTSISGTGSGTTNLTYYVHANVAGSQVGQGAQNSPQTVTGTTGRTLTITY